MLLLFHAISTVSMFQYIDITIFRNAFKNAGCCSQNNSCVVVQNNAFPESGFTCADMDELACLPFVNDTVVWDGCETCYGNYSHDCFPPPLTDDYF